jgi:hypothetical protein
MAAGMHARPPCLEPTYDRHMSTAFIKNSILEESHGL